MHHAVKAFAGVMLAVSSLFAFAVDQCLQYQIQYGPQPSHVAKGPNKSGVCAAAFAGAQGLGSFTPVPQQAPLPSMTYSASVISDLCTVKDSNGQDAHYWGFEEVQGACEEKCPAAGTKEKVNFTTGWAYSNDVNKDDDAVDNRTAVFSNVLSNGACGSNRCHMTATADDLTGSWRGQVAGPNGLYRTSSDMNMTHTGQVCTPGPPSGVVEAAMSPSAAPPPCPGTVGTVNGVKVCLGPVAPNGVESPVGGDGEATRGNPAAGVADSSSSTSERARGGTGNSNTNGASPAGGPVAGPGLGNNGYTVGCNDGSAASEPPCSGAGDRNADGTVAKPPTTREQAECGAPGQPKCRIDETGTPNGKDASKAAEKAIDDLKTKQSDALGASKLEETKVSNWTWTFQLPTGCTDYLVPGMDVSMNVCQFQGTIHDIMSMIWLMTTVWCCIGMVGRTLSGG